MDSKVSTHNNESLFIHLVSNGDGAGGFGARRQTELQRSGQFVEQLIGVFTLRDELWASERLESEPVVSHGEGKEGMC